MSLKIYILNLSQALVSSEMSRVCVCVHTLEVMDKGGSCICFSFDSNNFKMFS